MFSSILSNQTITATATTNKSFNNCSLVGVANSDQQHEHDLYVDLDTFWYIFLALITTIGLMVSFVSNMIIIYLFTRTPTLRRNPSNVVAVNLSLSDLLYCIQWPSVIYNSVTQSTWILENQFVCQIFGFITVSTALASILTILFMSIERAVVITHSIHGRNRFTNRTAWLIIVLIWILSIATSLPPLFGKYNRYTLDPSKTSCTLDYLSRKADYKHYILFLFAFYWIPPFFIISICYASIYIKFKRSSKSLEKVGNETELLKLKQLRRLKRDQQQQQREAAATAARRFSSSTLACAARHKLDSIDDQEDEDGRTRQQTHQGRFFSSGFNEDGQKRHHRLRDSIRLNRFVALSSFGSRFNKARANPQTDDLSGASSNDRRSKDLDLQLPTIDQSSVVGEHEQQKQPISTIEKELPSRELILSPSPSSFAYRSSFANDSGFIDTATRESSNDRQRQQPTLRRQASSRRISVLLRRSKTYDDLKQCCGGNSHSLALKRQLAARKLLDLNAADSIDSTTSGELPDTDEQGGQRRQQQATPLKLVATPSENNNTLPSSSSMMLLNWQQHRNQRQSINSPGLQHQQQQQQQQLLTRQTLQIRLAKMSFYLILLWIVSWTPLASIGVVNSLFECHQTSAIAIFLANTMTKLGPAFDVFIYGISHPKIKSKFKQILSCSSLFSIGQTKVKRKERMMSLISRHGGSGSFKAGTGTKNLKTSKMLSNRFSMRAHN